MSSNNPNQDQNHQRISKAHFRPRRKRRNLLLAIGIIFLILLTGGVAFALNAYRDAANTFKSTYEPGSTQKLRNVSAVIRDGRPFSVLLLGTDTGALGRHDTGRTDTIIVATVNPNTETAYLTSIPRDTKVQVQGDTQAYEKINAAYTIGGPAKAVETVQNLIDVPIDFYALVNMGGLRKMVDAVGGVDLKPLLTFSYGHANVIKGKQTHLDGKQALDYSRMREEDPLGDYGRQKRQRQVIQKLLIKAVGIGSLTRYKAILTSLQNNLKTDMTFNDLIAIRTKYGKATHHIKSQTLQGESAMIDGLSYQVAMPAELMRVSNNIRAALGLDKSTKLTGDAEPVYNDSTSATTGY